MLYFIPWTLPTNPHAALTYCVTILSIKHSLYKQIQSILHMQEINLLSTAINVLPDDGPVRSPVCKSCVFKNIIVNLLIIVWLCWLKLK